MSKNIFKVLLLVIFIIITFGLFTVGEDEVAVVKTAGKITKIVINESDYSTVKEKLADKDINISTNKGLNFKIPIVQTLKKYSDRFKTYISNEEQVDVSNSRKIDIKMYAQYRIVNPEQYSMSLDSKRKTNIIMDNDVYPVVIQAVNELNFEEVFDSEKINKAIDIRLKELNEKIFDNHGILIEDIGIYRKQFPPRIVSSIEEKMVQKYNKEIEKKKAEGDSFYKLKVAEIDREEKEIISKAIEEAAITKANADAEAMKIYRESLGRDLNLYKFLQRMKTYKKMNDTTIFLDSTNEFIEYINGY